MIDVLSKLAGLWVNARKEIMYSQASQITFICPMIFNYFPLDTQVCHHQFLSLDVISFKFYWLLKGVQIPSGLLLLQHGEDDLQSDSPRLCTHVKVRILFRKDTVPILTNCAACNLSRKWPDKSMAERPSSFSNAPVSPFYLALRIQPVSQEANFLALKFQYWSILQALHIVRTTTKRSSLSLCVWGYGYLTGWQAVFKGFFPPFVRSNSTD